MRCQKLQREKACIYPLIYKGVSAHRIIKITMMDRSLPNMKRAIATHEATFMTITILVLQATLLYFGGHDWCIDELFSTIQLARVAMKDIGSESEIFKEALFKLKSLVTVLISMQKSKNLSKFTRITECCNF